MPLWDFVLDSLELLCAKSFGLNRMRTPRINNLFVLGLKTIEFLYKYNGNMRFWQTMAKKTTFNRCLNKINRLCALE